MNAFGKNIYNYLNNGIKKISKKQFASELFKLTGGDNPLTVRAITKWENGEGYPTFDKMIAISKLMGKSIDELLKEEITIFNYNIIEKIKAISSGEIKTITLSEESKADLFLLYENYVFNYEMPIANECNNENKNEISVYFPIAELSGQFFIIDEIMNIEKVHQKYFERKMSEIRNNRMSDFFKQMILKKDSILYSKLQELLSGKLNNNDIDFLSNELKKYIEIYMYLDKDFCDSGEHKYKEYYSDAYYKEIKKQEKILNENDNFDDKSLFDYSDKYIELIEQIEQFEKWNTYPYDEFESPEPQNPWFFNKGLDIETVKGKKSQQKIDRESDVFVLSRFKELIDLGILSYKDKGFYQIGNFDDHNDLDGYVCFKFILNLTKQELAEFLCSQMKKHIIENM